MAVRLPVLVFLALVVGAACGPVAATSRYIDARDQVQAALTEGADTYAPYEYTKAQIYLRKAKELEGRSDYQQAMVFAGEANDMARRAIEVAKKNKVKAERLKSQQSTGQRPAVQKKVIEVQGAPVPLSPGGAR